MYYDFITIYHDFNFGLNRSWTHPHGMELKMDMELDQLSFQNGRSQWGKQTCLLFVPALWFRPYPENQTEVGKPPGFQGQTRPVLEESGGPTAADLIWLMVLECGQLLGWGLWAVLFSCDYS